MEDLKTNELYDAMFIAQHAPNPESLGVANMLEKIYPALARKIFNSGDKLIRHFVMTGYNPIRLLNMPLCGHCESLAYRFEDGYKDGRRVETCMCHNCGTRTFAPAHFRDWLEDELRHKMPKGSENQLDMNLVDAQAVIQVSRAMMDYKRLQEKLNVERNVQMGVKPEGVSYREKGVGPIRVRDLSSEEVKLRKPELDKYFEKKGSETK